MKSLNKLPIGIQYFANIRESNYIYIDKTEYIYNICSLQDIPYFLSRPRRFGKSLLLDTIAELFLGNKPLFEGLWIADKWDFSQTFPIIRLSLDTIKHPKGLEAGLLEAIKNIAEDYDIAINATASGGAFQELIKKLVKITGKQVVILIDEYDKPITSVLDLENLEEAKKQRDILKDFFGILKNASKYIRFLFITGISKFARVSIFSELNHLQDLTLHPDFAAICGYTQAELEFYFKDFLDVMPNDTLQRMEEWYDGYSWDGKTWLYNPFSVLNFFSTKKYSNFWFSTGTPTFIAKILYNRFQYHLERMEVSNNILDTFVLDNRESLDIISLLLQTGYLTIKEQTEYDSFILDYPNEEVRRSFARFLLHEFTVTPLSNAYNAIINAALDRNDLVKVMEVLHNLIQAIPDQNYINNQEKFVHAVIHLIFTMVGADVHSEVHTPKGRMDTVVFTKERIFIFEFKMSGSPDEALQCIEDRNYIASLKHRNKKMVGVGVVFSLTNKGIDTWKRVDY